MSRPHRAGGESGATSAFVVGIAVTLLAVAGLGVDGGHALNARRKRADDTEQAARAGAQQIDETALRGSDVVRLDRGAAYRASANFLARFDYANAGIRVAEDEVTVRATDTVDTVLLSLIGIGQFDISAEATAEAVTQ